VPAILKYVLLYPALVLLAILAGLNIWGALTLGTLEIDLDSDRNKAANRTVMVFGATGSVGDGLLKAVLEDEDVEKIYVVTRRNSSRIDAAVSK
jgi:FlaA1/EpsC-like NDP-sugar epimerase